MTSTAKILASDLKMLPLTSIPAPFQQDVVSLVLRLDNDKPIPLHEKEFLATVILAAKNAKVLSFTPRLRSLATSVGVYAR